MLLSQIIINSILPELIKLLLIYNYLTKSLYSELLRDILSGKYFVEIEKTLLSVDNTALLISDKSIILAVKAVLSFTVK